MEHLLDLEKKGQDGIVAFASTPSCVGVTLACSHPNFSPIAEPPQITDHHEHCTRMCIISSNVRMVWCSWECSIRLTDWSECLDQMTQSVRQSCGPNPPLYSLKRSITRLWKVFLSKSRQGKYSQWLAFRALLCSTPLPLSCPVFLFLMKASTIGLLVFQSYHSLQLSFSSWRSGTVL